MLKTIKIILISIGIINVFLGVLCIAGKIDYKVCVAEKGKCYVVVKH